ncbi:MAG: DUF2877 domain-containing protein [Nitrososphaerota archaeon]|nr:DUF2877 domain-containing protein [Nitrososphaerota archaeon]MDG6928281.1 DUF2877 domain-containing protein [Nitrososphaerota archaeon]MDG6929743.1 DUF2877 domain-containing protein [Nitrososphaerota archaeon]MDG6932821.1 DUF2877 domain-containing protein [Nitrososphaerota archaeon]MDG6935380.1 DUF2877 domain-containing protein [Nitrososphaerota archaeon]
MQIFDEAINVLGNKPLWILGPSKGPQPLGIKLNFLPAPRKGDLLLKDDKIVRLGENYEIDLTGSKIWSTSGLALVDINRSMYNKVVFWAKRYIVHPEYVDALINGKFELHNLDELVIKRLRGLVADAIKGAGFERAKGMIGLGTGLTPSGDDALVGMLASLRGSDQFAKLAKIVKNNFKNTNWISQGYLQCAAMGEFGFEAAGVIEACNDANYLEFSIKAASQIGQSSGSFFMLGFISGLKIRMSHDSAKSLKLPD